MIEKQIADGMRKIRKSKGLTLKQLGQKIGISPGMLSRLENNQSSPPIATLAKIAQGLEVPISIFFEVNGETTDQKYIVTRNDQRRQVVRRGRIGFIYYAFNTAKDLHLIEAFIMEHPPIKKKIKVLFDHPGEELILVLRGSIELIYGHETIRLAVGDAIHFDPSIPHRAQNVGKDAAECLVVIAGQKDYFRRNT